MSHNPICYGPGVPNLQVAPIPIISLRTPATTDIHYPLGQPWVYETGNAVYYLTSKSAGSAHWEVAASPTGAVSTLTGDSGTAVPVAGNIQIAGTANQISSIASGAIVTLSLPSSVILTTLTATTIHGTTIDTNVAAAQLSLNATTLSATGSNTNVDLNITTKGSGSVIYSQSKAGTTQKVQITNSDNTAVSSPAGLELAVGGATNTGDPYINFLVSGAGTFTMGIDNSVSDNFVIAASTALGTSNVVSITSAGAMTTTAGITATLGDVTTTNGNVVLATAGNGVKIKEGSNARMGSSTLTNGTVTVSNTSVTANTRIFLNRQAVNASTALGLLSVGTVSASTSFVINALKEADATVQTNDVSTISWVLIEPSP